MYFWIELKLIEFNKFMIELSLLWPIWTIDESKQALVQPLIMVWINNNKIRESDIDFHSSLNNLELLPLSSSHKVAHNQFFHNHLLSHGSTH